jgi:tRNA dimethylallyltransferase
MEGAPVAVFLMGPTGAGKTELAVELVERHGFEIISVDSAMIYRGMDIGTAKPDAGVQARAPHRLIDIRDPAEVYSAAQFSDDALAEIETISRMGRTPLLVGGAGLYFRALGGGLSTLPPAQAEVRLRIEREAAARGWPAMHGRLAEFDQASAARIHPNDPQRIARALEVLEVTGQPMSAWLARGRRHVRLRTVKCAIAPRERAILYRRLAQRFHDMIESGLQDEVEALFGRGDLTSACPSMRVVGYRQMWQYLEGRLAFEEMVECAVAATRRLAKRQLTWLRGEPDCKWFDAATPRLAAEVAAYILPRIYGTAR